MLNMLRAALYRETFKAAVTVFRPMINEKFNFNVCIAVFPHHYENLIRDKFRVDDWSEDAAADVKVIPYKTEKTSQGQLIHKT